MHKHHILPFQQAPDSICVLRLSAIGDICHTLPVINAIRDQWPTTKITWVIGKVEAGLIGDIPGIHFVIYDKKQGRAARDKIATELASETFDILLHMQISLRSSLIARRIKAPIKLGFDKARAKDFQWLFTNQKIAAKQRQHVMDGLFGFAEAIGVARPADKDLTWGIPTSDADLRFAQKHMLPGSPNVVISPCSSQRSRNFRNWSVENYIAVAKYAIERYGVKILVTGGNSEIEHLYAEEIVAALEQQSAINLVGETSLKELYALLQDASVLIGPDSGPAHIANSCRTPVIGLYATSNPLRTGPYFSTLKNQIVNAYPAAAENFLNKGEYSLNWGQRIRHPNAMELISVESVKRKLDLILGTSQ